MVALLGELLVSILAGVAIWGILVEIFDPKGLPRVQNLISNLTTGALQIAGKLLGALSPGLAAVAQALLDALNANAGPIFKIFVAPAAAVASAAFTDQEAALTGNGLSTPENAVSVAATAMGNAFGKGLASAGVAAAFEAAFPEKLNTLNGVAPMLAQMAGFGEVADKVLDPLYSAAFGRSLEYHYRSVFKPELPDEANAVLWHARRLLTDDQLSKIFGFSGLKAEYEGPFVASAYRSVNPRAIATLFEDTPFPTDDVRSMLEFYGARPFDIGFLLDAYERATTKNLRHQYLAALLVAAEKGTIDQPTLDSHLDTLNFSATAKNYVHTTVAIKKLEQLAELYRKSVTTLYETGQLTDAQYIPALQAIGIADADAQAHYAVDSARFKGRAIEAAQRAEARFQAQLLREQIGAIKSQFMES